MWDGIVLGFSTATNLTNILMVIVGCFVGTLIGMLPGLGPISAIALMIPITYGVDPASGIILMAGVYYGAIFGGSTSSILINAPGCSATVVTAFDGYPLAQKGQAGKALALAAYSSFIGGTLAALILLVAAPMLATVSLSFQSSDYFALMVVGLTAISAFAGKGQFLKSFMMVILGLMLSTIGTDHSSGIQRFTFGRLDLIDGLSFLLLAMATFALAEALIAAQQYTKNPLANQSALTNKPTLKDMSLTKQEVKEIAPVVGRSSILGFLIGVLPGAGATIAAFMAYGTERNLAKAKARQQFGQGSIKGLAAPEAANNAASTGSFVPLLTLGIPGSGTTAIMLGALISYGIQPGPRLFLDNPEVFWSVIVSMYLGNIVLLILNLPLIPYLARLLTIPQQLLIPLIVFFSLAGVYLVSFNNVDILIMTLFAAAAIGLRRLNFPMAPLLLGFILGGMLEDNLRRALLISDGSLSFLWERPLTFGLMLLALLLGLLPVIRHWFNYQLNNKHNQATAPDTSAG